jgi:hypothetical protein
VQVGQKPYESPQVEEIDCGPDIVATAAITTTGA